MVGQSWCSSKRVFASFLHNYYEWPKWWCFNISTPHIKLNYEKSFPYNTRLGNKVSLISWPRWTPSWTPISVYSNSFDPDSQLLTCSNQASNAQIHQLDDSRELELGGVIYLMFKNLPKHGDGWRSQKLLMKFHWVKQWLNSRLGPPIMPKCLQSMPPLVRMGEFIVCGVQERILSHNNLQAFHKIIHIKDLHLCLTRSFSTSQNGKPP